MTYHDRHQDIVFAPLDVLQEVRHLVVSPFGLPGSSMHEYRQDALIDHFTEPTPQADVLMVIMHLRDFAPHQGFLNNRAVSVGDIRTGDFRIHDLREQHFAHVPHPFHTVHLFLPNTAFARTETMGKASPSWALEPDAVVRDPTLRHLMHALLPTLGRPEQADKLFCDHVLQAAIHHISKQHGRSASGQPPSSYMLSRAQERLAKELMISRISGDISIEEVAAACGLSADYFGRMFRRTTGLPPYRWLGLQRIERAKSLLRTTHDSLVEIAFVCGFADQSHFTRTFTRLVGVSPGEWRRQTRS